MFKKPLILSGLVGVVAGGFLGFACQGYDVTPVVPKAVELEDKPNTVAGQAIAPNIMIVVDRSGSMTDGPTLNASDSCADSSGCYAGTGVGNCKWNSLLNVFVNGSNGNPSFIEQLNQPPVSQPGNSVQLGLTYFSGDTMACQSSDTIADECSVGIVAVPVGEDAGAAIANSLMNVIPAGGTPSAATMAILPGAFPPPDPTLMVQRANYAILLTDGAPNCNANFQPTAANCSADRCTLDTSSNACTSWDATCPCWFNGTPIPQTCLDESGLVSAIQSLYTQSGIKTFVIGFGVENGGGSIQASIDTLNQAALAGGVALDGGPSPAMGFTYYFAADSEADLQAALNDIANTIAQPCVFNLDSPPPSQELIEVLVTPTGGSTTQLAQTDFTFNASTDQVNITNPTICGEISSSTPNNPVSVDFKYLTSP